MKQKKSIRWILGRIFIYIVLILLAASFLYPLFFMFFNSLKTQAEYMMDPFSIRLVGAQYQNYYTMVWNFNILKYFWNTLLVVCLGLGLGLVFAIMASYAFAKVRFWGRNTLYLLIMTVMFIPAQVTIIPLYVMFSRIGLVDSLWGLILLKVCGGQAGLILLLTANFSGISTGILDAAKIDGCGYGRTVWIIAVPMVIPALSICVIINFIAGWNDLFTPMVLIKDMNKQLVMPALSHLVGRYSKDVPAQMTGMLMASVPAVILYLCLQKKIIMGVSMGAIK